MGGVLFDTNILTAFRDWDHSKHRDVDDLLLRYEAAPTTLFLAPQSIYEYWAVATRPRDVNGLGLGFESVEADIKNFGQAFQIRPDPPGLLDEWLHLCRTHAVLGKNAHDARLAAYARLIGIDTFVTLNDRDFARFGLEVVVP